jgi:hypothetical protein
VWQARLVHKGSVKQSRLVCCAVRGCWTFFCCPCWCSATVHSMMGSNDWGMKSNDWDFDSHGIVLRVRGIYIVSGGDGLW